MEMKSGIIYKIIRKKSYIGKKIQKLQARLLNYKSKKTSCRLFSCTSRKHRKEELNIECFDSIDIKNRRCRNLNPYHCTKTQTTTGLESKMDKYLSDFFPYILFRVVYFLLVCIFLE